MKSDIRVSVVIPVYNREKTISYCLESVLKQTFPAFEIIVIDDNSTDDTVKIVKSITDKRIHLITMPSNKGAQAARNMGIKLATGNYIAFLDSDDEWLPEKLEVQVREIVNLKKPCIVHCDAWVVIEEKNEKKLFNVHKLNGYIYKELLTGPGPLYSCLLAPKECFEKIGFLDENVPSYQEWDTSIALARLYEFIFIDKPLIIYHLHEGETISKDIVKEADGWRYIVEKYKDAITNNIGKRALAKHYSQIGMLYYKAGDFARARIYFYKALREDYKNPKIAAKAFLALCGADVFKTTIKSYYFLKHSMKFG